MGAVSNIAKKIAKIVGYNVVVRKRSKELPQYEPIMTCANYAPWLVDKEFLAGLEKVKDNTLIDKYRLFEIWQMVEESAKLPEGDLIEVGVWRGGSGALIAKKAKLLELKSTVYLCDTFSGVVKAGDQDSKYIGGEHSDTSVELVKELMKKFGVNNTEILVGMFPEDSANLIEDKKFRFAHVDVDVYQSSKDIVNWIWPRLLVGGIIVFDDYGYSGCDGVTKYINEERIKKDRVILYNLNGHAIMIKTS